VVNADLFVIATCKRRAEPKPIDAWNVSALKPACRPNECRRRASTVWIE
jgi:hypothetical protein